MNLRRERRGSRQIPKFVPRTAAFIKVVMDRKEVKAQWFCFLPVHIIGYNSVTSRYHIMQKMITLCNIVFYK